MALRDFYTSAESTASSFAKTSYHDGQTFTTTASYTIGKVSLKLYRDVTNNPGNVTAYIYATTDGLPIGSILCTTNVVDCSSITTSSPGELVDFVFDSGAVLSDATMYAVVILSSNGTSPNLYWSAESPAYYDNGHFVRGGSPTWYKNTDADHTFEVHDAVVPIELAGTGGGIGGGSGILTKTLMADLVGTGGGVGGGSAVLLVSGFPSEGAGVSRAYKRIVAAGNDRIYFEDI